MVSVGKNLQTPQLTDFIAVNGKASGELDDLFAELFSLVSLESSPLDGKKLKDLNQLGEIGLLNENNVKVEDLEIKDENALEVAKSLIDIFYNEVGINDHKENVNLEPKILKEKSKEETTTITPLVSEKNNVLNKKNIQKKILFEDLKNLSQINKFIELKDKKILNDTNFNKRNKSLDIEVKLNTLTDKNINLKFEDSAEKKTFSDNVLNKQTLKNTNKDIVSLNSKVNLTDKKTKKKAKQNILQNDKQSKQELLKKPNDIIIQPQINKHISNQTSKKSDITSDNLKNINERNNSVALGKKNSNFGNNFNTQDTLDLLESSWGEKFAKILKTTLSQGSNKVNIQLNPKNLGKISLEVAVKKDNSTKIQISTETQEAANLINENLSKIEEIIENKNNKFSNFNNNNGENFFKNQRENKSEESNKISNLKKKNDSEKTNNKNIHNIDVQA